MTDPRQLREFLELAAVLDERPVPCRTSPETWFADDLAERDLAIAACAHCPALTECRAYADAAGERHGIWAGVDRGRRTHRRAAA